MKKLGFGFMRLPVLDDSDRSTVDFAKVNRLVDRFIESGFAYFDTARAYQEYASELAIGRCVASRYPRERFFLANKVTVELLDRPEELHPFFSEQLERCRVDYFDNYLLHNMGEINYQKARMLGAFDFAREMKEKGKTKAIGFSFHDTPELLEQILTEHPDMDYVQLQINYLDWNSGTVQAKRCWETAARHGKKIHVMEPLKGGTLAALPEQAEGLLKACRPDWSPACWALRFAAGLKHVDVVLSGMNELCQLDDNIATLSDAQPLNAEELGLLDRVAGMLRASIAIPCTDCGYCLKNCPAGIDIPKCFTLYNGDGIYTGNLFSPMWILYGNAFRGRGKAGDCLGCGRCERSCPQHIPIREWLTKVAGRFETDAMVRW